MKKLIITFYALVTLITIFSCANRGAGPQGGPKDTTPPQVVKYSPADGCTNMKRNRIEITFDEIVVLKDASQKVVVSPPQRTPADIKAISHKIVVEFADSLLDSTTYSIDFTDAIADNNEGNKLDGFTYCFSTGDYLDSLEIAGRVLCAENLNPAVGIIVGVHSLSSDTAFVTTPFSRIAKTDEDGFFIIHNLPHGSYQVFALSDIGGNFLKDMPGEEIAFLDTFFIPERTISLSYDTIKTLNGDSIIDSVVTRRTVTTSPDDLLLFSFVEHDDRRFLDKVQRPERHHLMTLFTGSDTVPPTITPLNFPDSLFSHVVTINPTTDTLSIWLRDTALWRQDTLRCLLSYTRRDYDSVYTRNDTVSYIFRHARTSPRKNTNAAKKASLGKTKTEKPDGPKPLPKLASFNASSKFDIYAPLQVRFAMPTELRPNDSVSYHLLMKIDTLWREIPGATLVKADDGGTLYTLSHKWEPSTSYRLILDSSLVVNMIGQTNGAEIADFTVKSLEEYSKLILHLSDVSGREVLQLLDSKDKVVRQIALADTSSARTIHDVIFEYISPGTYYLRLFSDDNGDGIWTPGLYSEHRQPEEVIYFPFDIELRAFWDVEEDWTPSTTRLSKPRELIPTKNK